MWFFFFKFVYMMDYIDGFLYTELHLHPWDEAYLIMADNILDVYLNSVCENFISQKWSEILFLIRVTVVSWKEFNNIPSVFLVVICLSWLPFFCLVSYCLFFDSCLLLWEIEHKAGWLERWEWFGKFRRFNVRI